MKYFLLGFLLIVLSVFILLQIPAVQTYMAQKGAEWLSQKSGYKINLDKVKISWLDEIDVEGVHIYDLRNEEMVHVSSIHVDYDVVRLYKNKELALDYVSLNKPEFTIGWYKDGGKLISFSQFVKDLRTLFVKKNKNKKKKVAPFFIYKGKIENGSFTYFNKRGQKSTRENYFDYNYFTIDEINGDVENFRVLLDSISFKGVGINGNHQGSHLKVKSLDTEFLYCNKNLLLDKLEARIGESVIKDSLSFTYRSTAAFSNFNKKVKLNARLQESVVNANDLAVFAPNVSVFNDKLTLSAKLVGKVNDFRLKDLDLTFGKNSRLTGDLGFQGLPNIEETLLDLKFENSRVTPSDIRQYIRNDAFHKQAMSKFGTTKFSGNFRGFINNFVAYGDFNTQLGELITDVNFVIDNKNQANTTYSGFLRSKKFNLGKFLGVKDLGEIDLNAKVKPVSKGFTTKDGVVNLDGKISRLVYKKYAYQGIKIDARLSDRKFSGDINITDPNLVVQTKDGVLDVKKDAFNIDIKIDKADFKKLGFTKDTALFKGIIDVEMVGLDVSNPDIDNINGYATFKKSSVQIKSDEFDLDGFKFSAEKTDSIRDISIFSNYLDFSLNGNYTFKKIVKDFPELVKEYRLYFLNDQLKLDQHYARKDTVVEKYAVTFKANLKDVEPLLAVIDTNYAVSNGTQVTGELKRGTSNVFNFYTAPDFIRYEGFSFYDNEIDISSSKLVNSPESLGSVYIKSAKQRINGIDYFDETDLLVNISDDEVKFSFKTNQFNSDNFLVFKGEADFFKDSLIVSLKDSYFHLLRKDWLINDENLITVTPNKIKFDGISFNNSYQLLAVDGVLSNQPEDKLLVKLRDFDLENLQSLTTLDIAGLASGNLEVSNALVDPKIESKVLLKDLVVNNDLLGKLKGTWDWQDSKNVHEADFIFLRNEREVAYVKGAYSPNITESPLDFKLDFKNTDFNLLEPFLSGILQDLKGKGNGTVQLSGTLEKPSWDGKLVLQDAGFRYDYFKTYYEFSHEILFKEESFLVKNLVLRDTLWKTEGTLNGSLSHNWFKNYSSDLVVGLNKTFLLNTKAKDNSLYYGTAFGTGKVLIQGPFSDLQIFSDELRSNKGTQINIPLEEPDKISKKDYIQFVTTEEKLNLITTNLEEDFNISGVSMDVNFNLTKDAEFRIIFDENAGDEIVGVGDGLVNLSLSTLGDFNMYGTYQFSKGSYNFTFIDLINKKFDISNGGKITWDGDPYQGELDINATYEQFASLRNAVFIDSTSANANNPDLDRRVPILINLGLKGNLLNPEVDFNVNVKEYPNSLESVVAEFESKMRNNDQLKNKQVFSLIVLKQLAPEESIGNIGTSTSQNLSELFSNQFSSWISQFDENLDVAIDLSGFDAESNNIFRVKLAYSLLDGRIRVTRDGSFQNVESSGDLANVFGEWTIEYLITEDGKIRMKAYNKNTISNSLATGNSATSTTYGISLTHNKSFNNLRELFKSNPNKEESE